MEASGRTGHCSQAPVTGRWGPRGCTVLEVREQTPGRGLSAPREEGWLPASHCSAQCDSSGQEHDPPAPHLRTSAHRRATNRWPPLQVDMPVHPAQPTGPRQCSQGQPQGPPDGLPEANLPHSSAPHMPFPPHQLLRPKTEASGAFPSPPHSPLTLTFSPRQEPPSVQTWSSSSLCPCSGPSTSDVPLCVTWSPPHPSAETGVRHRGHLVNCGQGSPVQADQLTEKSMQPARLASSPQIGALSTARGSWASSCTGWLPTHLGEDSHKVLECLQCGPGQGLVGGQLHPQEVVQP